MTKHRFLSLIGLLLGLAGCTTSQQLKTDDGSVQYRIKCFDSFACEDLAASLCNGSYKILNTKDTAAETWVYLTAKCEAKRSRRVELSEQ